VPKASGRACYCAPGFFTNETTAVTGQKGFTCFPCRPNYYCPGSRVAAASSTARFACGANKQTTTDFATSDLECSVLPGYGWEPKDGSAACPVGTYNPGFNARKCTPCPGGLTTLTTQSKAPQDCLAGVGFYHLRGKAVACARGTYKAVVANQDCDKCPTGISTPYGTVSADAKTKCQTLLPGYEIQAGAELGDTNATECPPDTFRSNEVPITDARISCTRCPNGLVTLPNVTGASTLDACVVPPGYGWSASQNSPAGKATICPVGQFNPGYSRQPCASCGTNLLTDAPGATNADACYTPAGWGSARDAATEIYNATICPVGTFGRPNK
jgi:hypothetical protein